MMRSAKLLALAAAVLFSVPLFAAGNYKTVKRSEPKAPEWTSAASAPGYIMVTAEAPTLQEVREKAGMDLLRAVIQSVATNVEFSSTQKSTITDSSNGLSDYEELNLLMAVNAAKLPFVKGVSLSEADTYWELLEDKKSKLRTYVLNVRYPFPDSELARLRKEFNLYDAEMSAQLESLDSGFSSVDSAVGINEAIGKLKALEEYFFDGPRLRRCQELGKRYRELFKSVEMSGHLKGDGVCIIDFTLRGKPFKVGRHPEVTSECASDIHVKGDGDGSSFKVTFSTEDCIAGEQNSLKATCRLGSARLSTSIPLK